MMMKKGLTTLLFVAIIVSNIYSQDRCVTQPYNQLELGNNGLKHFSDSMNSIIYKNAKSINSIGSIPKPASLKNLIHNSRFILYIQTNFYGALK